MTRFPTTMTLLLSAALFLPTLALAGHHEGNEKAGGNAADHRSEQAEENSNAQWQEGAERGKERARNDDASGKPEKGEKREKAEKPDKGD